MRTYKQKVGSRCYADCTSNNLRQAVDDVKSGKLSVREAANKYSVPKSTVSRKVCGGQCHMYGHPTVFSA